jgi:hypothetical protein
VLIIGGGPSYWDIAKHISPHVKGEPLVSTEAPIPKTSSDNQRNVPKVQHLLIEEKGVAFTDGRVETCIDILMLCTGYLYDFPFIVKLCTDKSRRVCNLWDQMFWIPDATLSFVGLPKKRVRFSLSPKLKVPTSHDSYLVDWDFRISAR